MNRFKLIVLSGMLGFVTGGLVVAQIMSNGGIFGDPQFSNAYVLKKNITLRNEVGAIELPTGITVNQYQNIDGQSYYTLHFYDEPFGSVLFENTEKWEYFYIQK